MFNGLFLCLVVLKKLVLKTVDLYFKATFSDSNLVLE